MGTALLVYCAFDEADLSGPTPSSAVKLLDVLTVAHSEAKRVKSFHDALQVRTRLQKSFRKIVAPLRRKVTSVYHAAHSRLPWGLDYYAKRFATPDLSMGMPGGEGRISGASDLVYSFEPRTLQFLGLIGESALEKTKEKLDAALE